MKRLVFVLVMVFSFGMQACGDEDRFFETNTFFVVNCHSEGVTPECLKNANILIYAHSNGVSSLYKELQFQDSTLAAYLPTELEYLVQVSAECSCGRLLENKRFRSHTDKVVTLEFNCYDERNKDKFGCNQYNVDI